MKKRPKRKYMVLKAVLMVLRGYMASPATMATYSGPTQVKEAWKKAPRKPSRGVSMGCGFEE